MQMDDAFIVALAGRRIDADQALPMRFPTENVSLVQRRLDTFFATNAVAALVCSGACGADLLALEAAIQYNIFCCIILPFGVSVFKAKSVLDCIGDWEKRFDHVNRYLIKHPTQGKVVCLHYPEDDHQAYTRTNQEILNTAEALLKGAASKSSSIPHAKHLKALVVWDGQAKPTRDATENFALEAQSRNIPVTEISTLA